MAIPAGYAEWSVYITSGLVTDGYALTSVGIGASGGADQTMCDDLTEAFRAEFWHHVGMDSYVMQKGILRDAGFEFESPVNESGPNTGTAAPPNIALLVKKSSHSVGRENRGRMYIPGVLDRDSITDAGTLSGTDVTAFNGFIHNWAAAASAVTGVDGLCILHKDVTHTPTAIESLIVEPMVATQRRRLRR